MTMRLKSTRITWGTLVVSLSPIWLASGFSDPLGIGLLDNVYSLVGITF